MYHRRLGSLLVVPVEQQCAAPASLPDPSPAAPSPPSPPSIFSGRSQPLIPTPPPSPSYGPIPLLDYPLRSHPCSSSREKLTPLAAARPIGMGGLSTKRMRLNPNTKAPPGDYGAPYSNSYAKFYTTPPHTRGAPTLSTYHINKTFPQIKRCTPDLSRRTAKARLPSAGWAMPG